MKENYNSIVYLRAVAAMMVLFYHYVGNSGDVLPNEILSLSSFGQLGVHMFFVISGFVIPLQLEKHKYEYRDMGKFFLNRFLRIYPCFIVVLVGATLVWKIQHTLIGGVAPDLSVMNILYNLGLVVNLFGGVTFLGVAWTLFIEFFYYVVLGLLFPLMFRANDWKFVLGSLLLLSSSFIGSHEQQFINFFKWTPFFVAGFSLFMATTKGRWRVNLGLIGLCLICITLRGGLHPGWVQSVLCALTLLFIKFGPNREQKLLTHLGVISFSVYLVHAPIGHKVLALSERILGSSSVVAYLSILLSTLITIIVATALFYWVEKPSNQWSRLVWKKRTET